MNFQAGSDRVVHNLLVTSSCVEEVYADEPENATFWRREANARENPKGRQAGALLTIGKWAEDPWLVAELSLSLTIHR